MSVRKKVGLLRALELSFVLVVTLSMLLYGIGKWVQFSDPASIQKQVAELTGMELMWAFYGYSKTYALLLGVAEMTGAILFLIRPTRILGGLLLSGILLNVIVQDIIYEVNIGALRAAILYQGMVFFVLWLHRQPLRDSLQALLLPAGTAAQSRQQRIVGLLLAVAAAALWKVIEYYFTH